MEQKKKQFQNIFEIRFENDSSGPCNERLTNYYFSELTNEFLNLSKLQDSIHGAFLSMVTKLHNQNNCLNIILFSYVAFSFYTAS